MEAPRMSNSNGCWVLGLPTIAGWTKEKTAWASRQGNKLCECNREKYGKHGLFSNIYYGAFSVGKI